jgi:hypothetical protein
MTSDVTVTVRVTTANSTAATAAKNTAASTIATSKLPTTHSSRYCQDSQYSLVHYLDPSSKDSERSSTEYILAVADDWASSCLPLFSSHSSITNKLTVTANNADKLLLKTNKSSNNRVEFGPSLRLDHLNC